MSIGNLKILDESQYEVYISIKQIKTIVWSQEQGKKLKEKRGDMSLKALSEELLKLGVKCADSNLNRMEHGHHQGVPLETLMAICKALRIDATEFLDAVSLAVK